MSKILYKISVVMVVYKSQDGWRGFCVPYDVSCNAKTKEEAKEKLEELVKFYEEGLNKYGNPQSLIVKELSDEEDNALFKKIWPRILKEMENKMKSYSDYVKEELDNSSIEKEILIKNIDSNVPLALVEYYKRPVSF